MRANFIPAVGYAGDLFIAGLTFGAQRHYADRYYGKPDKKPPFDDKSRI